MKIHLGDHKHHGTSDGVNLAPVDLLGDAAGTDVLQVPVQRQLNHFFCRAGQGKASLVEKGVTGIYFDRQQTTMAVHVLALRDASLGLAHHHH